MISTSALQIFSQAAGGQPCTVSNFLGIPPWYQYLVTAGRMKIDATTHVCELVNGFDWGKTSGNGGDVTLIALGILDIALRVAGLVAIGFVIYGSIQYVTSDGAPDQTKEAQQTIINALVGLVIALIATTAVGFLGRMLSK